MVKSFLMGGVELWWGPDMGQSTLKSIRVLSGYECKHLKFAMGT